MGCGLSRTRYCDPVPVPLKGAGGRYAVDQSTARLLCQEKVQTGLFLATVDNLKCVAHATFVGAKGSVQKSELVIVCETEP